MKFILEASNVFLSTSSVNPGDLSPFHRWGKWGSESLRNLLQTITVPTCSMSLLILLMFFTVYTHLVLNQCQLTRTNWPEVPLLARCCPGLEETGYVLARKAVRLRAEWLSSFNPTTSSLCLTLLGGVHPKWMNTVHFQPQDTVTAPRFRAHLRKIHVHANRLHLHIHGSQIPPGPQGCLAILLFP